MSGVFPVGCGSAAPREHIIERKCILQKFNKYLIMPLLLLVMVFLFPVNVLADVREMDEDDAKVIRSFLTEYNPGHNYLGTSTVSHCTCYIVYSSNGGLAYEIKMLPAPAYVSNERGWYTAHLPVSNVQGRNNNSYTFLYNMNARAFKSTTVPYSSASIEDASDDSTLSLCYESWKIVASNFDLVDKDGTVFFQRTPLPVSQLWEAMGTEAPQVQRQLLQTGKRIAIVIILVVSYLIFPVFWRKCLESLLP